MLSAFLTGGMMLLVSLLGVFGFAGGLKKWHGVENLLEAFRRARPSTPDAHLLIVGDGPMRGWIEEFVRRNRLGPWVSLTGWVPHDELPALIARMRAAGLHCAIGGISLPNPASVALHEKLGFVPIGRFREVGFKQGRWVDVGYWELTLA